LAVDNQTVAAVVAVLQATFPLVTSVNGPAPWAQAIAQAMGTTIVETQGVRLHQLQGSPRLPHQVAGRARLFSEHELPLLQSWLYDFSVEAAPEDPQPRLPLERVAAMRAEVYAWTVDDVPVAMARAQRPFCGGWSIGPVFTPMSQRRQGYGGAVVFAQCTRLITEGCTYVALYTNLANPTSNKLYAAIGFSPVLDQLRLRWTSTIK
jgi:hypothetical protein